MVNIQRELVSLTKDATAIVSNVARFGAWGEQFNARFPSSAEERRVLQKGAAAMLFYEHEFTTISRQAANISSRASRLRLEIESLLA